MKKLHNLGKVVKDLKTPYSKKKKVGIMKTNYIQVNFINM